MERAIHVPERAVKLGTAVFVGSLALHAVVAIAEHGHEYWQLHSYPKETHSHSEQAAADAACRLFNLQTPATKQTGQVYWLCGTPADHDGAVSLSHGKCSDYSPYFDHALGRCVSLPSTDAPNHGECGNNGPTYTGNPIHVATGNKYQSALDYAGAGASPLHLARYYNSQDDLGYTLRMGAHWRHSYERYLFTLPDGDVMLVRPDGKRHLWLLINGVWKSATDVGATLSRDVTNWLYSSASNSRETFDANGRLHRVEEANGLVQTLVYDVSGRLVEVSDDFGGALKFQYDDMRPGFVAAVTLPDLRQVSYSYDTLGNLVGVAYPADAGTGSPGALSETYHYEDQRFPSYLTGVTDASGTRAATWRYGDQGRAILSEHAGGVDQTSLVFNPDGTTTVTDAHGHRRVYTFSTTGDGVAQVASIAGGICSGCAGTATNYVYDARGFLSRRTDANGTVVTYVRDDLGREISRTEAAGTPQARTVTTEWHPTWRKPTRITEPDRVTEYLYSTTGQIESTKTVPTAP